MLKYEMSKGLVIANKNSADPHGWYTIWHILIFTIETAQNYFVS